MWNMNFCVEKNFVCEKWNKHWMSYQKKRSLMSKDKQVELQREKIDKKSIEND